MTRLLSDLEVATLNAMLLRASGIGPGAKRDESLLAQLTELAQDPDAFRAAISDSDQADE